MARTIRDAKLETRTARLRLKARKKPYFTGTGKAGVLLGYRRTAAGNGSWVVKRYRGRGTYGLYETETFAQADDYSDSDGPAILDYFAAMKRLRGELSEIQRSKRFTVSDAVTDYIDWLRLHRKSAEDSETKLKAYLIPYFHDQMLSDLRPLDFEKWLAWAFETKSPGRKKTLTGLAKTQKRKFTKPRIPKPEKIKAAIDPGELKRKRRSTINRLINTVKACLNHAYRLGNVESDTGWRRLQKFKGADAARKNWLTVEQCKMLLNACPPDFRRAIEAALLTGARWGEIRNMRAGDYDAVSGTILIAEAKGDRARRVPLTVEGQAAYGEWTAGRPRNEIIFTKDNGNPWGDHDQHRPMVAACAAANIDPAVPLHTLRHSYASSLVQAGVSLSVVAEALGHRDTRMVSLHYGHLAPSHVADAIRANLPDLGLVRHGKLMTLSARV